LGGLRTHGGPLEGFKRALGVTLRVFFLIRSRFLAFKFKIEKLTYILPLYKALPQIIPAILIILTFLM
jgi:hypothetical protein